MLILGISKFVAKVRIIWELANFRKSRSASRTGDCETSGTGGTGETGGSASRTGDCETSGTSETSGTGGRIVR